MSEHIIITGASRGIGLETALRFARKGYLISICAHIDDDALSEACKAIETEGGECFSMLCDIGNATEAEDFIQKAFKTFGTPSLLINNAGISCIGLLQDMTTEQWNRILQTNLSSLFHTCKTVIPLFLQEHRGRIINISSIWGTVGAATEVAYSATKGGVNAFTKALAKELAPSHIPVNAIACGYIDTSMNDFLSKEDKETLLREIPAGRAGRPEEVACLVEKLNECPEYITGQILTIDGGWY